MATSTKKAELPYNVVSFAQNREDLFLFWLCGQLASGFYIDVGANDPDDFSVTRMFYDFGWSGINIEPIPRFYEKLCLHRPTDINLKLGVSDSNGELTLREYINSDGLSTFSEADKRRVGDNHKYKEYTVPTKTLADICQEYVPKGTIIDFLKVDVEGFEYEVLAGNDWKMYRPRLLCIEANHVKKDWRKLIRARGYRQVFFDGLNEYWAEDEAEVRKQFGDYSELFLSGRIVEQQRQYNTRVKNELILRQTLLTNSLLAAEKTEQLLQMERLTTDLQFITSRDIKGSMVLLLKSIYRSIRFRTLRLIWGPTAYKATAELLTASQVEIDDLAAAKRALLLINSSDQQNINIVVRKNKTRKFIYELLRHVFLIVRKHVRPPKEEKHA